ncbi:MAG: hypothetical protein ACYCPV_06655 [Thermoplasmata archaeon]|jgi:hypothetical protein
MTLAESLLASPPRRKVAEALLRLAGLTFSRAELAREAGLFRTTVGRIIEDLEAAEVVVRVPGRSGGPMYRTNLESPIFLAFARFSAALELVELTGFPEGLQGSRDFAGAEVPIRGIQSAQASNEPARDVLMPLSGEARRKQLTTTGPAPLLAVTG